jgi:hypothetical protein
MRNRMHTHTLQTAYAYIADSIRIHRRQHTHTSQTAYAYVCGIGVLHTQTVSGRLGAEMQAHTACRQPQLVQRQLRCPCLNSALVEHAYAYAVFASQAYAYAVCKSLNNRALIEPYQRLNGALLEA